MTVERMNQMADNDKFLYEHMVQSKHVFDGNEKTDGIKIWAGNARFQYSTGQIVRTDVSWDGFFSPGCNPMVSVTLGRRDRNRIWVSVKGPGTQNWPNSRGCEVYGVLDPDAAYKRLDRVMPLHIIAIGY